MKKLFIILSICLVGSNVAFAKGSESLETTLFKKGMEEFYKDNYAEALSLFEYEVSQNPKNALAYTMIGTIYYHDREFDKAMSALDNAIRLMPKDRKKFKAICYYTKGDIETARGETAMAVKYYTESIKIVPDESIAYLGRADLYYKQKKYDLSDADYVKAMEFDDDKYMSCMGLGRNASDQGKYDVALSWFQKANELDDEASDPYFFKAQCYYDMHQYKLMAENLIESIERNMNNRTMSYMKDVSKVTYNFLSARIQVKLNSDPTSAKWLLCMAELNQDVGKNRKAVEYFRKSCEQFDNGYVRSLISDCCKKEGDFAQALIEMEKAAALDSTYSYMYELGLIYDNLFMYDDAIKCFDHYVLENPEDPIGYVARGWTKWYSGDDEGAIEDFKVGIDFDYLACYGTMGMIYEAKGDTSSANIEFRLLMEKDTIPYSNNFGEYARLYLQGKDATVKWMKERAEGNKIDDFYEFACIYSLTGDVDSATIFLEKELMQSRENYNHMQRDFDLENLRKSPKYLELLEKYRPIPIGGEEADTTAMEERTISIPMRKSSGGVYTVDCKVNSLPLSFIFDTGAADVSLSSVEAAFMLKNNYISSSDVVGKTRYMTASGDVYPGTILNLKKISIGGIEVSNVRASVVKNQSAPILLGQSVLNRFGKVEIDYNSQIIRITRKEKTSIK